MLEIQLDNSAPHFLRWSVFSPISSFLTSPALGAKTILNAYYMPTPTPLENLRNVQLPLSELIRPATLSTYIGQRHLINPQNGAISNFLYMGYLPSMILYGPPGVGKTTLASIMASHTNYVFQELSATDATVAQLRELSAAIKGENAHRLKTGKPRLRLVVFIDEIHRFSTTQQDFLLPFVEAGDFVFIGATTVDPHKRVRRAILSRCQLFQLEPLVQKDVVDVLRKAALYENIRRKLLARLKFIRYTEEAFNTVAEYSSGDTRTAINFIELISSRFNSDEYKISGESAEVEFTVAEVESAVQSLTRARFGLKSDENLPLFKQLFDTLNGEITYEETLERNSGGCSLVSVEKSEHALLVKIKVHKAKAIIPEFENTKKVNSGRFRVDNMEFNDKEKLWLDHMDYLDDSDVEPGEIYSDEESQGFDGDLERVSAPLYKSVSAVHTLLLLLRRGESEMFLMKQLMLYVCKFTSPELAELRQLVAVMKAMKKANVNTEELLSDSVERLAGLPKNSESLESLILSMKEYRSKDEKKVQTTREEILEIVFDEESVEKLLEEIPDKPIDFTNHFSFSVEIEPNIENYSLGWRANSASEITL